MVPLIMPTDWQFNYLFQKHNFKVAWSNPPAFIHGSQSNIIRLVLIKKYEFIFLHKEIYSN